MDKFPHFNATSETTKPAQTVTNSPTHTITNSIPPSPSRQNGNGIPPAPEYESPESGGGSYIGSGHLRRLPMEESMSFSDKGSKLPPLTDEPKKKKKKKKKSRQDREEERDNEGYEDSMNDTAITHM